MQIVRFCALTGVIALVTLPSTPSLSYMGGDAAADYSQWDCGSGKSAAHPVPINIFCGRSTGIVEQVETAAGILTRRIIKGNDELWLGEKKLATAGQISMEQAYPEKKSLPLLVTIDLAPQSYSEESNPDNDWAYVHIIDVGVTPPFISKEPLPITGLVNEKTHGRYYLKIEKTNEDTYVISGESLTEKDKDDQPLKQSVKYDRKTGTITKL